MKTAAKKAARKPAKKTASKPSKKAANKKAAPKKAGGSGAAGKQKGDAGVRAYIAQLPPGQRAIAAKVDATIAKSVPGVKREIKWNVPFYGLEGKGWFCGLAAFKNHTSLNFFRGEKLKPAPSDGGVKENRRVAYRSLADIDEPQLASWVRQAAALPGWLA